VYGSYSFTGLAWVLESSDLVLTAPNLLLKQYKKFSPIKIFPCPVDLGTIDVRMVWHAQTNEDPLRVWFRRRLKEICAKI
jgi:DNA-binding transcriptional LysR family regulator